MRNSQLQKVELWKRFVITNFEVALNYNLAVLLLKLNFIALQIHLATVHSRAPSATGFVEVVKCATGLPFQDEAGSISKINNGCYVRIHSKLIVFKKKNALLLSLI